MLQLSHCRPAAPRLPEFIASRIHRSYTLREEQIWRDRHFLRQPKAMPGSVELHTNDYLQMSRNPAVIAVKRAALLREHDPGIMSAIFLDDSCAQRDFETELASFVGSEASILCQSGWAANVGLLQTIAGPDVPIHIDFMAHMSLQQGARESGAQVHPFRHNDADHLARSLRDHGPGIIVVDSVYSTHGSLCPLVEMAALARRSGSVLIVDESHSLGTHGPRGAGVVCELGLEEDVLFRTASLSKAFGARGGVIACPREFVDYFRTESTVAIFSSAVHAYEARGFSETLRQIERADAEREQVRENASRLRAGLAGLGYPVQQGSEQIISLESGTEHRTLVLRDLFAERGILGAPFVPPATPTNRSLLRLTVTCALSDAELEHVVRTCADLREEIELDAWDSLRRSRRTALRAVRRAPMSPTHRSRRVPAESDRRDRSVRMASS